MPKTTEHKVIVIDVKGAPQAIKDINALQKHAKNADKNIARMGKTMGNLGFTIKAFIAYRLTAYLANIPTAFINVTDSMSLMQSRLKLVNDGSGDLTNTLDALFTVAENSRGSIDAVSTLYTRLAVSTKELGASQQEVLDFTELVSNTFLLSGASAGEAASGVTQISQAMAKGKLDGDEFKSVMENNIYFGKLLAQSLGVTRGELLEMSKAGKITAKELIKMGEKVDIVRDQVGNMPTTFDQMTTAWGNAIARMVTDADSLNDFLDRFNKSMTVTANRIGEAFSDSPIKAATEAIDDQISKVAELQSEVNGVTPILGKHMSMWDRISQSAAPIAFERAAHASRGALLQANIELKQLRLNLMNLEHDAAYASGNFGPQESVKTKDVGLDAKAKKIKTLSDILKEYAASQKLANGYVEQANELWAQGELTGEQYNHVLEKFATTNNEAAENAERFKTAQEELDAVIASGRTPFQVMIDQMKELDQVAKDHEALAGKVAEAQAVIAKGFTPEESQKDEWIDWGKTAETAVGGITGAFVDMAVSGKNSFADFAESFLINIAKMIAQQAVLNAISSPTGGLFGLFPSANGNAFNNGQVMPFASGGVVSSPTLFPMANGIGLMGEAGPEAILPLSRGADGKLGVESSGGGATVVNINNYGSNDVSQTTSTDSSGGQTIDIMIEEKVNAAMKNGGLDRQMGSSFGIRRKGY